MFCTLPGMSNFMNGSNNQHEINVQRMLRYPRMQAQWTFLTNHAHVLLCLARDPDATLREVAEQVGITERAAHRIVGELEAEGALTRRRDGRRNHYEIDTSVTLRHALESDRTVGSLLSSMLAPAEARRRCTRAS